jgi:hypothetical protein
LPALYEKAPGKNKQKNADLAELPNDEKNDDRKLILPALHKRVSGKNKPKNTDLDELA